MNVSEPETTLLGRGPWLLTKNQVTNISACKSTQSQQRCAPEISFNVACAIKGEVRVAQMEQL